jgi:6-pyruvoyltetrahydropterin/6-carboxytetrahydropterin synthase
MHTIEITGITFAAAHRVENHPKCSRLHGHNYEVSVVLVGDPRHALANGMVADFGVAKKILKSWIDDKLDHRYLVSEFNRNTGDPYRAAVAQLIACMDDFIDLPIAQTTAELLAEYLCGIFVELLFHEFGSAASIVSVTVKESANTSASYWLA